MFGSVEGDVEVFVYYFLLDWDFLSVEGQFDLAPVPAFCRVLDQQSTADPGKRVGHIRRNGNAPLDLVQGKFVFLSKKCALARPERKYGHSQRVKIRFGAQLDICSSVYCNAVGIHLRSRVNWGSDLQCRALAVCVHNVGYAEVAEHAVIAVPVPYEYVGGLYVFVQHHLTMQFVKCHSRFDRNCENRLRIALQPCRRGISFRVKVHQLVVPSVIHNVGYVALSGKPLQREHHLVIDSETFVQALQSVSFTVVGDYVQFSFRAPAELFLDGIVPPAVTDNLARLVSE